VGKVLVRKLGKLLEKLLAKLLVSFDNPRFSSRRARFITDRFSLLFLFLAATGELFFFLLPSVSAPSTDLRLLSPSPP